MWIYTINRHNDNDSSQWKSRFNEYEQSIREDRGCEQGQGQGQHISVGTSEAIKQLVIIQRC
jgi:hypothetical protein